MLRTLFKTPLTWAVVAVALVMGLVMTASYLGAFLNPNGNMRNLPIAIVSEDSGATIGGKPADLGRDVIGQVTGPNTILGNGVTWTVLATRDDALGGLGNDTYYAAIVIPSDFSAKIAGLLDSTTIASGSAAPANVEVLTNPAAGAFAGADAQQISLAVVRAASDRTSAKIMAALGAAGATMPALMAGALAQPIQPVVTVAQVVGDNGGRGLAPFYFVLMLTLAGFVAANIIDLGVRFLTGHQAFELLGVALERPRIEASASRLWAAKLALVLLSSVGIGALQTSLAVGALGMTVSDGLALAVFSILGAAAISTFTLLLLTAFGEVGALLGVLVTTIFGVPSAGGVYPLQMVPEFFRVLGDWLPLRYLADGARALTFYDGRFEAGLGTALVVLAAYAGSSIVLGAIVARLIDRVRERRSGPAPEPRVEGEALGAA